MRVLVCGGRDFGRDLTTCKFIAEYLDKRLKDNAFNHLTIIEGDALGADKRAGQWAIFNNVQLEVYPADWERYGKRAGYIRNKQMLEEGKPDLVIAFPGGKGTANMVKLAREAGVPVEEVTYG
jgi:hypothetical protein